MTAQACVTCGHVRVTRSAVRAITAPCADFRACWQWDHTCRTRIKFGKASSRSTYSPAMLGGKVVPNARLAA